MLIDISASADHSISPALKMPRVYAAVAASIYCFAWLLNFCSKLAMQAAFGFREHKMRCVTFLLALVLLLAVAGNPVLKCATDDLFCESEMTSEIPFSLLNATGATLST